MNADWRWEYDPDHAHVAGGIPGHVVAQAERLAGQLVDLSERDGLRSTFRDYALRFGE